VESFYELITRYDRQLQTKSEGTCCNYPTKVCYNGKLPNFLSKFSYKRKKIFALATYIIICNSRRIMLQIHPINKSYTGKIFVEGNKKKYNSQYYLEKDFGILYCCSTNLRVQVVCFTQAYLLQYSNFKCILVYD
jgi:hypothetical protein